MMSRRTLDYLMTTREDKLLRHRRDVANEAVCHAHESAERAFSTKAMHFNHAGSFSSLVLLFERLNSAYPFQNSEPSMG